MGPELTVINPRITDYYTQAEVDAKIASGGGGDTIISGSLLLVGSGSFAGHTGYSVEHNLGYDEHSIFITAAGVAAYSSTDISKIGTVYVKLGSTQDIVYNTGGSASVGLPFTWLITTSGDTGAYGGTGGGGTATSLDCADCIGGNLLVDGSLIAPSGVFYSSVQTGISGVKIYPDRIVFADQTEISTASNVVTCTGTEYTINTTYSYSDPSFKELFELPAGHELQTASITVVSGFDGNFVEDSSSQPMETVFSVTPTQTLNNDRVHTNPWEYPLEPGAWITQVSLYHAVDYSPIYFCLLDANIASNAASVYERITFSGGVQSLYHEGRTSITYYDCDPIQVPTSGTHVLGIYLDDTDWTSNGACYGASWDLLARYTNNDVAIPEKGNTFTALTTVVDRWIPMGVVYGPKFSIGDHNDHDSVIEVFATTESGTIAELTWGDDLAIRPQSRPIYIYDDNQVSPSEGLLQVQFTYKERCGDWFNITAGTSAWVEQNGLNFEVSFVSDCTDNECTVSGELLAEDSYPKRLMVLPAGHIITELSFSVSESFGGGYYDTAGFVWSERPNNNNNANINVTMINDRFSLPNGQTITAWSVYSEAAGNITLKAARQLYYGDFTQFQIVNIDSASHDGLGLNTFVLDSPYTISGTGDWFLGVYTSTTFSYSGWYYSSSSHAKTGDLDGIVTSMYTTHYFTAILLHLNNSYSVGDDVDTTKFSGYFNLTTGEHNIVGSWGPYLEAKPVYLHQLVNEPDIQGEAVASVTYYDPQNNEASGSGVTWSGTGGALVNHFLGTLDHTLMVIPVGYDPGSWWISKGVNQDIVYSSTLSGTGTFDWVTKRL